MEHTVRNMRHAARTPHSMRRRISRRDRPRAQPEGLSCVGGAGAFGHGPCHQLTHASRLAGGEPIGSLISSCRLSLQVERVACCVQAVLVVVIHSGEVHDSVMIIIIVIRMIMAIEDLTEILISM